jgi:hypothetical protein
VGCKVGSRSVQGRCRTCGGRCCHLYICTTTSTCRVQSIHSHVVSLDGLYIPCICPCPVRVACPTAAYCTSTSTVLYEYSISPRSGCGTPEDTVAITMTPRTGPTHVNRHNTSTTGELANRSRPQHSLLDHHPQQYCITHLHTSIPISRTMPPRRNPRRQAQEDGSSDSDDSIDIAHTHAVKRPRPKPSKKVRRT